jgi:hypothetical protein
MKKILILQMRPEDETCESELEAILNVGRIDREQVHRLRPPAVLRSGACGATSASRSS